ncbi:tetratricopeptide repeat protein [Vampirovibrio sp.]|uniref:tetratricopeptide repeat protein n=1 Tax=Vampirovibrio sp. TaxID=2717857 RepID=UPI003594688A
MNFLSKVLNFSAERYLKTAGDLFIYEGDYESALGMVEKTLEMEPQDIRALVLRGDILYCLNRDQEALETFNRALVINPHSVEALISRAGVLDVLGKYREALECCNRAFEQILPYQKFLLPSLYDQNIVLLLRLKKYRQAQLLLRGSENRLPKEEHEYLLSCYSHILTRLSETRQKSRAKAKALNLALLTQEKTNL